VKKWPWLLVLALLVATPADSQQNYGTPADVCDLDDADCTALGDEQVLRYDLGSITWLPYTPVTEVCDLEDLDCALVDTGHVPRRTAGGAWDTYLPLATGDIDSLTSQVGAGKPSPSPTTRRTRPSPAGWGT